MGGGAKKRAEIGYIVRLRRLSCAVDLASGLVGASRRDHENGGDLRNLPLGGGTSLPQAHRALALLT